MGGQDNGRRTAARPAGLRAPGQKIGQNLILAHTCPQQAEEIADPNPYAPDAGSAAALERVDGDALR